MKPKVKYSTTKISPAKISSSSGKALVKSPKLRKSQEKAAEVCQTYFMQLRSGLLIEKKACDYRKGATGRFSPRTDRKEHLVFAACQENLERSVEGFAFDKPLGRRYFKTEQSAFLTTYNDQSISFVFEDGSYEIYVEDLRKNQEKDQVLFRYYDPGSPSSQTDDSVDGQKLMVNLRPTKCKDFSLHANNKEYSVELQKCANPLPDQAFFLLHEESSKCVSFECKNDPGVFIGVKDNHLALIKVEDETEGSSRENIIFKLS
ncbi:interleukin-33 [Diceros bicornis minor]|uniref:interleukin-33 n=1 Tax=Diceros bicornis minor TaxID=77932 RepID=UPI0026EC9DF1|nr:interleukin-33 [Diceros bicornis minor]XP_058421754.1 interleukin-33 [Diceros bicornis minor]